MASVFRRKGAWYVQFKDWHGTFKKQVTRALTKAEAQRLADDLERRAERQRLGMEELAVRVEGHARRALRVVAEEPLQSQARAHRTRSVEAVRACWSAGEVARPARDVGGGGGHPPADGARRVESEHHQRAPVDPPDHLHSRLQGAGALPFPRNEPDHQRPVLGRPQEGPRDAPRRGGQHLLRPHVPDYWLGVFVTALYTGMRKGEIFGLRKRDVDLNANLIIVSRSYDQETTKGKHADAIPIAPPLKPFLEAAIAASPTELVFPDPEGKMRLKESDPEKVLRRAMGRAGLVDGYDFVCRRCKARRQEPHTWRYADCEERFCPTCEMRLWPKAIPRQMKFHSLRHTVATLLLRAKVPMQHVQRILRHTDIKLTVDTYGHLVVEDLHDSVGTLPRAGRYSPPPLRTQRHREPRVLSL